MDSTNPTHFIIGSRKSDLALWQARHVHALLSEPGLNIEIRTEAAMGDNVLDKPLAALASAHPGIFTKELEVGLLAGEANPSLRPPASSTGPLVGYDVAVHSLKDMPTSLPPGLVLAGIGSREDPRDAFVVAARHAGAVRSLADLPPGAVVGTSSLRREAVLRALYPRLTICSVRGNLNTRIKKLDTPPGDASSSASGSSSSSSSSSSSADTTGAAAAAAAPVQHYDALVLAAAGLIRMGWRDRITSYLDPQDFPYGVGQGALGIEVRADDAAAAALAHRITHGGTALRCLAERAFLNKLQGGCQVPIGVFSYYDGEEAADWTHGDAAAEGASSSSGSSRSTSTSTSSTSVGGRAPAPAPADERVRTLTLHGTVMSTDGSHRITGSVAEPVLVPLGAPASGSSGSSSGSSSSSSAGLGVSSEQWSRMVADATRIGRALADRLLAAGAADILGPLTAPRPITYGAAEAALDRPDAVNAAAAAAAAAVENSPTS